MRSRPSTRLPARKAWGDQALISRHPGRSTNPSMATPDKPSLPLRRLRQRIRTAEYYMVADEVWAASGLAPDGGMLCLVDLERRLGRLLTRQRFHGAVAIPRAWLRSPRAARTLGVTARK